MSCHLAAARPLATVLPAIENALGVLLRYGFSEQNTATTFELVSGFVAYAAPLDEGDLSVLSTQPRKLEETLATNAELSSAQAITEHADPATPEEIFRRGRHPARRDRGYAGSPGRALRSASAKA